MSEAAWKPNVNPWIIAVTVTLATFMEVLDTSMNVPLPHIAGGLGASYDEATWVITCTSSRTRSFCQSARISQRCSGASNFI